MFDTVTIAGLITDATLILAEYAGPIAVVVGLWGTLKAVKLFRQFVRA